VTPRRPGGGWSAVLLLLALVAGAAVFATWVRGVGSSVPDSVDLPRVDVDRPGQDRAVSAAGASGSLGAILLIIIAALTVLAFSRLSPRYRALWAGYLTITFSLAAVALVLWFVRDPARQEAAFGASSVQLRADSVHLTWWPWVALACFIASTLVGVLLIPGSPAAAVRRLRRARPEVE